MVTYLEFWIRMIFCALLGGKRYYLWIGFLGILVALGVKAYINQLTHGFVVTNMSNQVSWGAYIANFTFLVGVAAAAVLLVFPSYAYHKKEVKEVVMLGEILAVSAIIMCLLFVTVDLGRPERFWHFIRINFPNSILAWDVVVLNGYLLLNLHIPGYLLYRKYLGQTPKNFHYLPFVYVSIIWAVSIHTVTAFLYAGVGSRPYWNSAILAPRFLVSAFAGGPAILLIIFHYVKKYTDMKINLYVSEYLKTVMMYALIINLFLFGCEIYKEFYTQSVHVASIRYLFFGLHGHHMLVPYIWSAMAMEIFALIVLFSSRLRENGKVFGLACLFTILGIWIEKGMGLLIQGFIPSPLGDVVEYIPSVNEFFVCLGIWAFGALAFTTMAKVTIAIEQGHLAKHNREMGYIRH